MTKHHTRFALTRLSPALAALCLVLYNLNEFVYLD